jgi:hypothetical protein
MGSKQRGVAAIAALHHRQHWGQVLSVGWAPRIVRRSSFSRNLRAAGGLL